MKAIRLALIAGVLLSSTWGLSYAEHTEPASAKKITLALVNSFVICDPPNTATQFSGTPACAPAVPDKSCAFSSAGSGKLSIAVTGNVSAGTQAIKIGASAKALNSFCEGEQLCVVLSYRATSDDCPEGSCTTGDITELQFGSFDTCCFVTGGVCKIKATVAASTLQIADGKNTGLELHGCGLSGGIGGRQPAVTCGILLH